jgi:3-hydroxyisobutyrate dehydrogenase-like beta-hydroxyacid dehydrogenase
MKTHPFDNPIIGLLYPGEMGAALGRVLMEDGFRVLTTVEGRGPRTRRLCAEAGLPVVDSLDEVVLQADVVVSLVPPDAVLELAETCAAVKVPGRPRWFVDANSVSPATAAEVGEIVTAAGAEFIDAAIQGPARQLRQRGVLYLSGPEAAGAASLFGRSLQVRVVGSQAGQASALKGLASGMVKGLAAVFLEMAVTARHAGLLEQMFEACRTSYPGLMELLDRLIPTYPQHAGRRTQEAAELAETMRALGLEPCLAEATRRLTADVAACNLAEERSSWTVRDVIEELYRHRLIEAGVCSETI